MSRTLEMIQAHIHRESHPVCHHCNGEIDMTDTERLKDHVSYWGEDEPVAETCPNCNVTVYLQEHVQRSWTVGSTPEEAAAL